MHANQAGDRQPGEKRTEAVRIDFYDTAVYWSLKTEMNKRSKLFCIEIIDVPTGGKSMIVIFADKGELTNQWEDLVKSIMIYGEYRQISRLMGIQSLHSSAAT